MNSHGGIADEAVKFPENFKEFKILMHKFLTKNTKKTELWAKNLETLLKHHTENKLRKKYNMDPVNEGTFESEEKPEEKPEKKKKKKKK